MNCFARNFSMLWILYSVAHAQNPVCPSPMVYMDGTSVIRVFDPSLPVSSNNPTNTNIPTFGSGLTLMPNLNSGTLTPTFYTTSNGMYYYWDGANWVSTGHSTGNSGALNIGGCGSYIYNLVGSNGQVYRYDGTGNGALLTTLSGFSGGGPFDLTTDCNCNFYAINTTTSSPGQSMIQYNSQGVPTASWSLVNMPNAASGGGFAIICNTVYLKNNLNNGFFIGTINGSAITFTQVNGFPSSVGDFASCPTCTQPPVPLNAQVSPAILTCSNPTTNLVVTTTVASATYSWSGPGIIGSATGSALAVNSGGIYTCVVTAPGCPPSQATVTGLVATNTSVVNAVLSPSGNICIAPGQSHTLHVSHSSPVEVVTWGGPGIVNSGADSIVVSGAGVFSVLVTNPLNGCYAQQAVSFVTTPSLNVAVSNNSMCAFSTNGSPAAITVTASGASAYSLVPGPNTNLSSTNSATVLVSALGSASTAFFKVIGQNSFCTDTANVLISVMANPTINLLSGNICPGETHTFIASGAASYTWAGTGLNSYYGPTVTASPVANSTYSVIASNGACLSQVAFANVNLKIVPSVSIAPQLITICLGSTAALIASGTASTYAWAPAPGFNSMQGAIAMVSPTGNQVYSVTGILNGCSSSASATVMVQNPPVLSLALSSQSICFYNYHGSPNSITMVPSGAMNYTLLSGPGFTVYNPFGSSMKMVPFGSPPSGVTILTTTLIGQQGVCTVTKAQSFSIIPNPVISISPPSASICPGSAQVFDAHGASTYTWLPSPGYHTYSPSGIVAYPKLTSFFSVIGTSLGCISDVREASLLVKPAPTITVFPLSTTVCAGNPVTLMAQGTSDSYLWKPSSSLSSANSPTVIATPLTTQAYTAIGFLNSCTNQAVATVSVIDIPSIKAWATESVICSSASTHLHASGAMSYKWIPDQTLNSGTGPIVYASPPANTIYTVTGFNGICSGSTTLLIKTVQRPDVRLSSKDGQNTVCQGDGLILSAQGAHSYRWSPLDYVLEVNTNSLVFVKPPVNTNFTIVGTTSDGNIVCSQLVSFSVLVVPKAIPLVTGSYTICKGERTTLHASGGNTFLWTPSTGLNTDKEGRVVASPAETTLYSVHVSNNTFCGNTTTVLVTVNPLPTVSAGKDSIYHINDPVFVRASGSGTITWESGEGISCMTCASTQVFPSRNGCYTARSINEFGCEASDDVCLEIETDFNVYVPNSFTPNGDGLNDDFKVYGENFNDMTLDIFDRWGQLIFTSSSPESGWDGTFKGAPCKPDMYVYKLSYKGLDARLYHQHGHVVLTR